MSIIFISLFSSLFKRSHFNKHTIYCYVEKQKKKMCKQCAAIKSKEEAETAGDMLD
jgi:hypothetical protein